VPSRWFAREAVASPHHLASAAGAAVLSRGGNAVDAAVAANLVLGVVAPYQCGVGGDLLAIVHDGEPTGVLGVGAMPAGATPEAVRAAIAAGHGGPSLVPGTEGMPTYGALAVSVPGAAAGWSHLLERWGSRSFGDVAGAAIELAEDGFPVSSHGAAIVDRARPLLEGQPGWTRTFGGMRAGERFVQPELAWTLRTLAEDGPDAVYRGVIGERIVEVLGANGASMRADDLAGHRTEEVTPLRGTFRDRTVLELPPPTQGVTALTALGVLDRLPAAGDDEPLAWHHQVEAVRLALRDRQQHVGDPRTMHRSAHELLEPARLDGLCGEVVDARAGDIDLGRRAPGGTAYVCAADRDGLLVSLIQSNFVGFGSGVVVPGAGFGLHDRGAHLRLDAAGPGPNVLAPGVRPLHTLIPAMTLRDEVPELLFGTMGGDGQVPVHVQLLRRIVDAGAEVQDAIDAPRFIVDLADGAIEIEADAPAVVVDGLRARGHTVRLIGPRAHAAGHAHAIRVSAAGYEGGSDPRAEGAVVGR
jgi:gamma-glutamyltranspeptidase / glutathione hydrolase